MLIHTKKSPTTPRADMLLELCNNWRELKAREAECLQQRKELEGVLLELLPTKEESSKTHRPAGHKVVITRSIAYRGNSEKLMEFANAMDLSPLVKVSAWDTSIKRLRKENPDVYKLGVEDGVIVQPDPSAYFEITKT